MARGTWQVQVKTAGVWGSDGTISPPNDSYQIEKISTQTTVQLADGSQAFITPSTKYIDSPINFTWYEDDSGVIKTKIEGYINNQNDVKIIDDLSNEYIGRFTSIIPMRIHGLSEETYDIQAIFTIMPGLA